MCSEIQIQFDIFQIKTQLKINLLHKKSHTSRANADGVAIAAYCCPLRSYGFLGTDRARGITPQSGPKPVTAPEGQQWVLLTLLCSLFTTERELTGAGAGELGVSLTQAVLRAHGGCVYFSWLGASLGGQVSFASFFLKCIYPSDFPFVYSKILLRAFR